MSKPVCVVTGVGPGTGTALVRRFVEGGYRVAMIARSADRLEALAAELPDATAYVCDVTDPDALSQTTERIALDLGAPEVLINNAVGGGFGDFLQIDPEALRTNLEVNVMAFLHLSRLLAPAMIEAGKGAIVCTGNTSAHRGKANFASFAPSKAAQRILAESMARSLGPQGVHVAYVTIDAVIDLEWTRNRFADAPDDFFIQPAHIADECFHVTQQPRSAWSFDVEIRPFGETW